MMEGIGEIMTLEEIAKYLKIGKSTLYNMASVYLTVQNDSKNLKRILGEV